MGWGALKSKLHEHVLTTLSKVKLQAHETNADPVIAKGTEVTLDTVTQCQKTPQLYWPASRPC